MAITEKERIEVARYRSNRTAIRDGPLYTILGDNPGTSNRGASQVDPFEGVQTYSKRYERKQRQLPRLEGRPFRESLSLSSNNSVQQFVYRIRC
jgi:DNA-directed RNA polymerase III subunit RPC7